MSRPGTRKRKAATFRVGDRAHLRIGAGKFRVRILEDRGNIGYKGGRIYRVRDDFNPEGYEIVFEAAEEDLHR